MALLIAIGLTGCTGPGVGDPESAASPSATATSATSPSATAPAPAGPDEWRRGVPLEPLTVPAQMVAPADRFDGGALVSGSGDNPALVAAIGTRPGGQRYLRVSRWTGTGFEHGTVTPAVPGTVQSVTVAGNAVMTALAGWSWQAGTITPFLLTSTDRRSWTPADLPAGLAGYRIVAVAVDGGHLLALAQHPNGSAALVSQEAGGSPTVHAVPERPAAQHRDVVALAVSGRTVAVLVSQGPEGDERPHVLRSDDGGATWGEPAPISTARRVSISGIVSLPTGFMVTGAQSADGPDQAGQRATAWFSPDARTWTAESLPEAAGFRWDDNSSHAGAPTAANGHVLVLIDSTSALRSRLLERLPSGQWIDMGATDEVAQGAGFTGTVVPLAEPTGSQAPGSTLVAIDGAGGLSLGRFASGLWATLLTPAVDAPLPFFSQTRSGSADRWRATVRQRHLEPWLENGWVTWWQPTEVRLDPGAIAVVPWDPADLAGFSNVVRGSAGDAELAIASARTDDLSSWHIAGWFRSAPGQPWTPISGFDGTGSRQQAITAAKVGPRWYVGGLGRAAAAEGESEDQASGSDQAMIWSSADGLTFTRADGDFAAGDGSSDIDDICTGADGGPVAVGAVDDAQGTGVAALWTERDGRWVRADLPDPPSAGSHFSTCAMLDGVLIIDGTRGDRAERWSWSAPAGFQLLPAPRVDRPDEGSGPSPTTENAPAEDDSGQAGSDIRFVQPAGSGYVAAGHLDSAAYTGPVLWVSPDARNWQWVPLPVNRPDTWTLVAVVGREVVVLASSRTDSLAWRVPDIDALIAGMPAAG